jgi:hypothetical protein
VTTFAANAGNVLQHSPLCEVVGDLLDVHTERLLLIDAYAMAPLARPKREPRPEFQRFQGTLRSSCSGYARAWAALAPDPRLYPSTANFLRHLWQGLLAMVLCESDRETADAISAWRHTLPAAEQERVEVSHGDWRARFAAGFQGTSRNVPPDFTIASFDPNVFSLAGSTADDANMRPDDIDVACGALRPFDRVLVQVSTYTTNGKNNLVDVRSCWESRFTQGGFRPAGALVSNRYGTMTQFFAKGPWPASRVWEALGRSRQEISRGLGDEVVRAGVPCR